MKPEWNQVTLERVRLACEMYDSGTTRPQRPAQNTFLLLNGQSYPAKFIRGVAYRLATNIELDPSRDYAGGLETVKFFQSLGLATQHGASSISAVRRRCPLLPPPSPAQSVPPPPGTAIIITLRSAARSLRRRRWPDSCAAGLVRSRGRPSSRGSRCRRLTRWTAPIPAIYHALQGMRGYSTFASFGKSLVL